MIRADGSHQIGMGHIMRGLACAQVLRAQGWNPIFVVRQYDPRIFALLQHNACRVESLAPDVTLADDAEQTLDLAVRYDARAIFADLSTTAHVKAMPDYLRYYEYLDTGQQCLVVFDDIEKVDYPFDIHVIPYYGVEHREYKKFDQTSYLLGCRYFIVPPHVRALAAKPRLIQRRAENVLVVVGGSDPGGASLVVAKALALCGDAQITVKMVIGPCFAEGVGQQIDEILQRSGITYHLCHNADIHQLLCWADLAITGGGHTKYEAAALGTPHAIISQFDIEAERSTVYAQSECAVHLGHIRDVSSHALADAVKRMLTDCALRARMSHNGKSLVDGLGTQRVIQAMCKGVLQ